MWVSCKCARRMGGVFQLLQLAERISEAIVDSELKQHRRNCFKSARCLLQAGIHEGTGKLLRHALFQQVQGTPFKRRAERQLH